MVDGGRGGVTEGGVQEGVKGGTEGWREGIRLTVEGLRADRVSGDRGNSVTH